MKNLDRLDSLLLHELDCNARAPLSQIAKSLGIGSDLVEYRLKRFLDEGIIRRFTPMFVPSALGLGVYKTYIKHRMSKSRLSEFLRELDAHPMLYWMCEGHGAWDLLFSLASRGAVEFHAAQDRILAKYGAEIIDCAVYTPVEVIRFPKHYLVGTRSVGVSWLRKNRPTEIDTLERQILEALSENCRVPLTEVAHRLGVKTNVVRYRLKKLEAQGAILGYRSQLDYHLLGMTVFKVFLELRNYDPSVREKIFLHCREQANITCYVQQIGSSQIEFEAETADYYHFVSLIEGFRERFGAHLGRVEYMLLKKDHFHRIPQTTGSKAVPENR